jgi:peptide-methionine (S)-S-oxide reductase
MGTLQKATFGAGCFWGVEYFFKQVDGVEKTEVGYLGGTLENPTYEQVKSGVTGHAEVVEVHFNPKVVCYEELLNVFWNNHNPTQLNRQGEDVGTQYRSAIFYHTEEQKKIAEFSRDKMSVSGIFKKTIVTEITPASPFYSAEEYHQNYIEKNGLPSCHI